MIGTWVFAGLENSIFGVQWIIKSILSHVPAAMGALRLGKSLMRFSVLTPFNFQCRPINLVLKGKIRFVSCAMADHRLISPSTYRQHVF